MNKAGALKLRPMKFGGARKDDVRTQFGALCWREKAGKVQVLLVTSRGSRRWIIPKGWPMDGATPAEAAATEAWEEAGAKGTPSTQCVGLYSYQKDRSEGALPCVVAVFPVKVRKLSERYPEAGQRRRKWVSPKRAAAMVAEADLRQILKHFDPHRLY